MTLGPMQVRWATLCSHGVSALHSWKDVAQLMAKLARTNSDKSVYGIGVWHGGDASYGVVLDAVCRRLVVLNESHIA